MAVVDADVRPLIPSTSITDLTPFITAAEQVVACMECDKSFTEAQIDEITKWLAAHFASITDPALSATEQKFEQASTKYSRGNSSSMGGILSTQYGQMANTLSCGCLVEVDKRKPTLSFA